MMIQLRNKVFFGTFLLIISFSPFFCFSYIEFKSVPIFDEALNNVQHRFVAFSDELNSGPYIHKVEKEKITQKSGYCFGYELPQEIKKYILQEGGLGCVLFEDSMPLRKNNSLHEYINDEGKGRVSFFEDGYLYFSTTDNSDPRTNEKNYKISISLPIAKQDDNSYKIELPYEIKDHDNYVMTSLSEILTSEKCVVDRKKILMRFSAKENQVIFSHKNSVNSQFLENQRNQTYDKTYGALGYNYYDCPTLQKLDRIVFVVGAPRSGTTLLNGILCGPNCYPAFHECIDIRECIRKYEVGRENQQQRLQLFQLDDISHVRNLTLERIDKLIAGLIKDRDPRKTIILKEPYLTLHLKYLKEIFGKKVKVVFIVRDPRDIICSWKLVQNKYNLTPSIDELTRYFLPFYENLSSIRQVLGEDLIFVRYEDIVKRDEQVFLKIEQHIGSKVQRESWQNMTFDFSSYSNSPTYVELYEKNITDSSIGNYKKQLSLTDCQAIEGAFHNYMKMFNYID